MTETTSTTIRQKHDVIDESLGGEYVMLHVNTSDEGLVVPESLKVKSSVTLKISRWFRGAMELLDDKVEAELLFDESYFTCSIPLAAVWGITTAAGENTVWPEAAPADVLISLLQPELYARAKERQEQKKEEKPKQPVAVKTKGHLRRVK